MVWPSLSGSVATVPPARPGRVAPPALTALLLFACAAFAAEGGDGNSRRCDERAQSREQERSAAIAICARAGAGSRKSGGCLLAHLGRLPRAQGGHVLGG